MNTPFATFVGLYTNVPEGGVVDQDQQDWFAAEMKAADRHMPLIVAMHHPIHSLDTHHSGSKPMSKVLAAAVAASGRQPDIVFAAHVHNYQRFTITGEDGRITPFIVAGNGGYHNLHKMARDNGQDIADPLPCAGRAERLSRELRRRPVRLHAAGDHARPDRPALHHRPRVRRSRIPAATGCTTG